MPPFAQVPGCQLLVVHLALFWQVPLRVQQTALEHVEVQTSLLLAKMWRGSPTVLMMVVTCLRRRKGHGHEHAGDEEPTYLRTMPLS